MSIRKKLVMLLTVTVLVSMLVSLSVAEFFSIKTREIATTETLALSQGDVLHILEGAENLVAANKQALDRGRENGVKTFLRSAADLLYSQVDTLYRSLPAEQRAAEIRKLVLSGKFGTTGYAFGMNTKGVLTIHPKSEGKSLAGKAHIDEMCSKLNGFIRYKSATTGREKVVYYRYFEPLDLILAPGCFIDELTYLIDHDAEQLSINQMYAQLRQLKVGKSGYFWVANAHQNEGGGFVVTPVAGKASALERFRQEASGASRLPAMIKEALSLNSGAVGEKKITLTNPVTGVSEAMIFNFKYFAPLEWVIGTALPENELYATSDKIENAFAAMTKAVVLATIILLILTLIISLAIANAAIRPIKMVQEMAHEMALGHLDKRLNMQRSDELGEMAAAMDSFADDLQWQVVGSLEKLANGDLTFSITPKDDRDQLRGTIKKLEEDLNLLMGQVLSTGDHIAASSSQVLDSSQSLSQGATESAASLEEITSSMTEMNSQTYQNADNAKVANELASEAQKAAEDGNTQMRDMVAAMSEINEAGCNISKIIKVIDEIAFQTNLLALNAAVEAARAGQHGKGFAVVAEEVRNLAARSAKAASETAELIEGSVKKTERGSAIADQTAEALHEIVNGIGKVNSLVAEIATASREQALGITQINQGLGQIDHVTQENTANAEQSAAAAEELNGQADHLQMMLNRFTTKTTYTSNRGMMTALERQPVEETPYALIGEDRSDAAAG